jgi:hypothetical protein
MITDERANAALEIARQFGQTDGDHHKMWVIDQMVRHLTGCPVIEKTGIDYRGKAYTYEALGESDDYRAFVAAYNAGEDGPDTYSWDEGIAP